MAALNINNNYYYLLLLSRQVWLNNYFFLQLAQFIIYA